LIDALFISRKKAAKGNMLM